MHNSKQCPFCGENSVVEKISQELQQFGEVRCKVDIHYLECSVCLSEFSGAEESRKNKRELVKVRKRLEGLLPGDKIKRIRLNLQISQQQAAAVLGGGDIAFSKYENNENSHTASMDALLRLIDSNTSIFWELVKIKGLVDMFIENPMHKKSLGIPDSATLSLMKDDVSIEDCYYEPKPYRYQGKASQGEASVAVN